MGGWLHQCCCAAWQIYLHAALYCFSCSALTCVYPCVCVCTHAVAALQLVSTVLTIALLGGAAWFYFQYGGSGSSNEGSSKGSNSKDVDLNDPLTEARKIMDKYKK